MIQAGVRYFIAPTKVDNNMYQSTIAFTCNVSVNFCVYRLQALQPSKKAWQADGQGALASETVVEEPPLELPQQRLSGLRPQRPTTLMRFHDDDDDDEPLTGRFLKNGNPKSPPSPLAQYMCTIPTIQSNNRGLSIFC